MPVRHPRSTVLARSGIGLALLAAGLLALAARASELHRVFLDDGRVALAVGDALYHAHRARYSLLQFPDFLAFDPCINFPHGASVPYPPLFDLWIAGWSLVLGGSTRVFERVAAWSPAVLGSLAVLPVFALGRRLRGAGSGVLAACLVALAPISVSYARVGYSDHHAAVALLGALLVAGYAAVLDRRVTGASLVRAAVGLVLVRVALLLTWQGALLYLGPGEVALLLAAGLRGQRDRLRAACFGALGVVALVAPFVAASALPLAGRFSATELSALHLVVFAGVGAVAGACLVFLHRRPEAGPLARAGVLGGSTLVVAAVLLLFSEVRAGVAPAFEFVGQRDDVGTSVAEQVPLFAHAGQQSLEVALRRMGGFVFLLPLLPLALWARRRVEGLSDAAAYLALWSVLSGGLALQQVRYANDFAPVASVGFALVVAGAAERAKRRLGAPAWLAGVVAASLAVGLQLPALTGIFGERAAAAWAFVRGRGEEGADRALATVSGTQLRFAEILRAATPEGPGCDGSGAPPEYAILSPPSVAHALHYYAGRATPADAFGPYIGEENFRAVREFFRSTREDEALAIAERLGTRLVVTEEEGDARLSGVGERLHRFNGSAIHGDANWGRFRLVAEGPAGGTPTAVFYGGRYLETPPFKLFEIVPGALLEVPAAAGQVAVAHARLETPWGRSFLYRARGRGEKDGIARLRLPYEAGGTAGAGAPRTRAATPYRVVVGRRVWEVPVSEPEIRAGQRVALPETASILGRDDKR